ncbi:hypothetical protein [Glycomyces tritici]|uniref:DUF4259 domain-containing protein n=1 Tax=Glycomyces tritici TaxID=2665176 RepID=A0ABT7YUC0_9ACTN|nr:hypothetical protein [Glycomyces tritici]MDN3241458.1 hypothetical protein [Glycomyces tritici]MDN3242245.1 hypothetical protein [Glycomyces tritici]
MGSWGVKALESDEGLEVLAMVEAAIRGRDRVTADELVGAARDEGLLGDDPAGDEYLYDMTALALAEILTGDTAQLADPGFGGTAFVATPEGTAALIAWVSQLRDGDPDREFRELRMDDPRQVAHVAAVLGMLGRMRDAR